MIHLITELSKYVMIILFAIYTWYSYVVLVIKNEERQKRMYKAQTTCMFLIHLLWCTGAVCAVFIPDLPDHIQAGSASGCQSHVHVVTSRIYYPDQTQF